MPPTPDPRVCTCTFDCTRQQVINDHLVGPAIRDTTGCEVHGVTSSPACVFCGQARRISDGKWIVSMITPRDCEHETIDGRT